MAVAERCFLADYDGNGQPPLITDEIRLRFAGRDCVNVVDAGCGDHCRVRPGLLTRVVGIDSSQHQLARNADLDEAIVADLDRVAIAAETYDLAVCWNVLEHLHRPLHTIEQLALSLRPGGAMVLAWPNLRSFKAVLARRLPYTAHVAIFRRLYPNAPVEDDHGPFATVLDRALTAERVESHLGDFGMSLRLLIAYESEAQRKARRALGVTGPRWRATKVVLRTLRIEPEQTDFVALFVKAPSAQPV